MLPLSLGHMLEVVRITPFGAVAFILALTYVTLVLCFVARRLKASSPHRAD